MEMQASKAQPGPADVQSYLDKYDLSSVAELPPALAKEVKAVRGEALEFAQTAQAKAQEAEHNGEAVEKKERTLKARLAELVQKNAAESRAREQARRLREEAKQAHQLAEEAKERAAAIKESQRKLEAAAREHKEVHRELLAKVVAAEGRVHKLRKQLDEAVEQVKELAATAGARVRVSTVHVKPDQMTSVTGGMATGGMFDDIRELEEDEEDEEEERGIASGGDKRSPKRADDWFVDERRLIDGLKEPLRRVRKLERLAREARKLREAALKRLDAGEATHVRYLDEDTDMEVQPPRGLAGLNGESNPPIYSSPEIDRGCAHQVPHRLRQDVRGRGGALRGQWHGAVQLGHRAQAARRRLQHGLCL